MSTLISRVANRWLQATLMPSAPALKMLKVMAEKGGKTSTFNINLLKEVLPLIGWSCIETVASTKLKSEDQLSKLLAGYVRTQGCEVWGYSGVKEPKEFWFRTQEDAEQGAQALLALPIVNKVAKGGPRNVQLGHLYVHDVQVVKREYGPDWAIRTNLWWVGGTAWQISSVSQKVTISLRINERGRWDDPTAMKLPKFWTWGYKNGMQEAARAFLNSLGQAEVERATRPQSARSLDNTGTCPCCFNNFKLTNGKIVRHGWKVQGQRYWGSYGGTWHSGSCYGVGRQPFELSSSGTEAYKTVMERSLSAAKQQKKLHASYPDVLRYEDRGRSRSIEKPADFNPNSREFAQRYLRRGQYGNIHEALTKKLTYDVQQMEDFIRTLEAKITSWTLQPLPGDR